MLAKRLRRVALVAVLAGVAAATVAVACGPGDLQDLTAGRDAGPDVTAEVDAAICVHASAPGRPSGGDGPSVAELVFAFDGVRFETGPQEGGLPKPTGLDLDMTCTCPAQQLEPESCVPVDAGGAPRPCDGDDGRDNAAGPLLAAAAAVGKGLGPGAFDDQIRSGVFNALLSVQGWNGQADDPEVVIGIQASAGIEGTQSDGGRQRPRFDGTDVWTVTPISVLGGGDLVGTDCRTAPTPCIPAKVDTAAYVRDGVLVGHFDIALPLISGNSELVIEFLGATLTARILKEGNHFRLAGEIAGRWPVARLLPSLARISNPFNPGHALCASDAGLQIYGVAKTSACASLDLAASAALDNKGARCEAISNAISFTGVTATVGTIYVPARTDIECAGFTDSCDD